MKFVLQQWQEHHFTSIIGNKEIYANYNDDCYLFKSVSGQIIKEEIYTLHCEQEEADSRMIFHMQMAPNHKNIVIRTCDTGVLIILLGNFYKTFAKNVWLEVGILSKNTLR